MVRGLKALIKKMNAKGLDKLQDKLHIYLEREVVGHETFADGRICRIGRPDVALGDSADRLSERVAGHTQQPPHPIRRVIMVEMDGTA